MTSLMSEVYNLLKVKTLVSQRFKLTRENMTDVVFTYGKVGFDEIEGECRLYFDYFVLDK